MACGSCSKKRASKRVVKPSTQVRIILKRNGKSPRRK